MNSVETALYENIDRPDVLFIFPTDVAASRWADHLLCLRGQSGTVAMEKFTAWDTFKQNSIRSRIQDKKSIPSILRKMFAAALIRENAELCGRGMPPVFTSLIKAEWSRQTASFSGWIAGILPQLGIWFRQTANAPIAKIGENMRVAESLGGDDRDLFNLALRYAHFLKQRGLFEPAWETPPFDDTGKECYIFFPESLLDFDEYRELLQASDHVKLIPAETMKGGGENSEVFFYANSRSEITEAALYILALRKNGISWDSISVSIPDKGNYSPYLLREFENRNIPYVKRSGKPLSSYPAGQFFKAVADCVSSDFSFPSLTALLLNKHLPWNNDNDINNLINFGIKNNCVNSWTEEDNGTEKHINVWEDAFQHPFSGFRTETVQLFNDLKRQTNALRKADSFTEIRNRYFAFRERFFDMDNALPETDTVLSRCVCELMSLVDIEKSYPDVHVPDPYIFFTEYLDEVSYLAQQLGGGVTILPYRTAAPAPFDCHIILGASQDNLLTAHSPLEFLSRSKRNKLGIIDNDASQAYINLHRFNSRLPAAFFCSEQTFTGYTIPFSTLNAPPKPKQRYDTEDNIRFAGDFFREERFFYDYLHQSEQKEFPNAVHNIQKQGFVKWQERRNYAAAGGSRLTFDHPLQKLIRRKFGGNEKYNEEHKGKISVSSSSLAPYFQCPRIWLFERVLKPESVEITAGLMPDNITGTVFHAVINLFLTELINAGGSIPFPSAAKKDSLPESCRRMLAEKIDTVFESFPRLPGNTKTEMSMLTARLLRAEKKMFYKKLEDFIAKFISFFADYSVRASESPHTLQYDSFFLNGIVDCILEDTRDDSPQNGTAVIVDFKTKYKLKLSDYTDGNGLADFQLPLYLRLAEAALNKEAHTALFFSIVDASPQVLFGSIQNVISGETIPKKESITRGSEIFTNIMNEFDSKAEQFAREISEGNFSFSPADYNLCQECKYKKICRTRYEIHQERTYGN